MFEVRSGLFTISKNYGVEDQDSPFAWEFETEEEARAFYAELDPAQDLAARRAERFCQTAGALFHYQSA